MNEFYDNKNYMISNNVKQTKYHGVLHRKMNISTIFKEIVHYAMDVQALEIKQYSQY